jgi:hypothetical protein
MLTQFRIRSLKYQVIALGVVAVCILLWGCSISQPQSITTDNPDGSGQGAESGQVSGAVVANVLSVQVAGDPDAYQFSVEVSSPDEGCDQYADWWEVVTGGGELVYRRILDHSHVDEQPFTRSGGPVVLGPDTVVFVRTHMHPGGYGGAVMRGSVRGGFEEVKIDADFAIGLENEPPQLTGCAF